jgi:SAM-dependent methyltransferase
VLRWLRAAYPESKIVAADVFDSMPRFCQRRLGADEAVVVPRDPSSLDLGQFDLIWVGSLLSHVDAPAWRAVLRFLRRSVSPRGLAVFTTHGQSIVAEGLRTRQNTLRFSEDEVDQVLRDYDETGFGYRATITEDHGDCFASPAWITAELRDAGWRIVLFSEAAWLGQDLVAVA